MPVDIRLTAVPTPGDVPLAPSLAAASGQDDGSEDLAVPVQGADEAGLDARLSAPVADVIAVCEATGRAGDVAQAVTGLSESTGRILFLGLGDGSPAEMRKAGAALARRVGPGRSLLTSAAWGRPDDAIRAFAEGLLLGSYRFSLKSATPPEPGHVRVLLAGSNGQPGALEEGITVGRAVALARDLANTPSARKSPRWLADEAAGVALVTGLSAKVMEAAELGEGGFGGILGVGSGSERPPVLIELGYEPKVWHKHVVLVGKGITFDSGGLSLKPSDGMKSMKTDMAGGAVVIATMSALARLGAEVKVTGLVAAAENMPSGSALHPGDVISHYGGRTTEVLNTDAEGRLVLADALAYAVANLQPDAMVDIATLTGAARVALGSSVGAMYASQAGLARALLAASAGSGEKLWQMPLVEDYVGGALESPVADSANVPHGDRSHRAGSIDAALFLREFTGGLPWAHLDVAGVSRTTADEGEFARGATGFGVRLLLRWLGSFRD